ncbi:MAG: peptide ABC transporter substrate-binding protein [Mogibacterium sp.]|nr:peptide ABC transporter substrate-binding protein [Mogibacterium sp.]
MKKLIALLLCMAMVFALAACGGNSGSGSEGGSEEKAEDFVATACIASEPETIDPGLISSVDGSTYVNHMFENLMKYVPTDEDADESGNVKMTKVDLGQAESYDVSEDGLTYTFKIRSDAVWSDGEPVKAQDWVYSWQRLVNPETASDYGYFLDGIVVNAAEIQAGEKKPEELGVKAVDDSTLEVTLCQDTPYFIEMCAFASLMPLREDVVEGNDDWATPEKIVVNGPYILSEWTHDSVIKMVPNEKYYDAANLGPSEIDWYLSADETAILSAYQSGEWAFIESFPTDMISSLQDSGDCFIDPYVGTYFLYLNCDKIKDWRVRAAMVLSMDRDNIVENVTQGGQTPATGFVASGILDSTGADFAFGSSELGAIYAWLSEQYPDYDLSSYDDKCDLAKKLYQEAVDEGKWDPDTTVEYNFNTDESHKAIAEACGQDWKNVLGMKITLANQEWNTYTNGLGEHKFGCARLGWIADYNDPITYLELMVTGNSYNYGLYSNEKFDQAIKDAKSMAAGTERDKALYTAEETLFGEGGFPVAPVYYYTNMYCNKTIKNIGYTSMGYYFFQYAQPAA